MAARRSAWKVWSPLMIIFMLSLYINRDKLQLSKTILEEESYEKFIDLETQRSTSKNEDIASTTLEKWKTQYLLPSIKDDEKSNLETRFISRRELLKEGCKNLRAKHESLGHQWNWQAVPGVKYNEETKLSLKRIQYQGRYGICVNPKVGSTTWKEYGGKLQNQTIKADHNVNMIQIRHPLDRLRSTYTDKFLGGEPISAFNSEYIKAVDSREGWGGRWRSYWLPALISTGRIQKPKNFKEAVKKLKNENTFYKKFKSITKDLYPLKINEANTKFANVSFTFEEFLRHVLWTLDLGLGDHHWIPQSELCNVCAGDFEYILKLENISEEIPYVLRALNYTKIPVYKHTHPSKDDTKKKSFMDFYKNIPVDLLRKILELYKFDFILFGYST